MYYKKIGRGTDPEEQYHTKWGYIIFRQDNKSINACSAAIGCSGNHCVLPTSLSLFSSLLFYISMSRDLHVSIYICLAISMLRYLYFTIYLCHDKSVTIYLGPGISISHDISIFMSRYPHLYVKISMCLWHDISISWHLNLEWLRYRNTRREIYREEIN